MTKHNREKHNIQLKRRPTASKEQFLKLTVKLINCESL